MAEELVGDRVGDVPDVVLDLVEEGVQVIEQLVDLAVLQLGEGAPDAAPGRADPLRIAEGRELLLGVLQAVAHAAGEVGREQQELDDVGRVHRCVVGLAVGLEGRRRLQHGDPVVERHRRGVGHELPEPDVQQP